MVEKCPAKYKNLNYIQSFSEQGYATIQLMQQACMNDEWLRQRVLKLNYLSSPAVRKWFKDLNKWVDETRSYGYRFDNNGNVVFNNTVAKTITVDFLNDEDKIDMAKTDAVIVSYDANDNTLTDSVDDEDTDLSFLETNDDEEEKDYDEDGSVITLDSNGEIETTVPDVIEESNIVHHCELPLENEAEKYTYTTTETIKAQSAKVNLTTRTIKQNQNVNSAWYVGFNKSKNYYVRPDWLKDWRDKEIPSVCRGQTFKATVTGKLESIDLMLDYTGTKSSNCGSPLYVQIWKTKKALRAKTKWNSNSMKMEYVYKKNKKGKGMYNKVNGKYKKVKKGTGQYDRVYEKVPVPDTKNTGIYKPLAQATFNPSKMKAFGLVNIKFDKEVKLVKGNSYFIALFSPLSEWKHCPRWGGWGRNCAKDKKYQYGNAFLSEDNGRSWIRFGRNDNSVKYKLGKYVPQDFAFQCHIRTRDKVNAKTETTITLVEDQIDDAGPDNPRYLYLKPILDNPIKNVRISANDFGGDPTLFASEGVAVRYYFSVDNRNWTKATLEQWYDINPGEDGKYPNMLFVKAELYRDITTMDGNHQKYYRTTPFINTLSVDIVTELPTEMYIRTHEYQPRLGDNILGANLWGRFYSNFTTEPTVECVAEIITNDKPTDHFRIIELEQVREYAEQKGLKESVISDLDNILSSDEGTVYDDLCDYLYNHQEIIDELKNKNVYIKPYEKEDVGIYRMSFNPYQDEDMVISSTDYADAEYYQNKGKHKLGGLIFNNDVAYPIEECVLTPDNNTSVPIGYGEWYDFKFDYDENILRFNKDVLENMSVGDIAVTYNKVFISGLTEEEVGKHIDTETGLKEDGLILDYFKQTFIIDYNQVEQRRVKLRVDPVDPIREVVLNRDTDKELELFEGYDYEVDIDNRELVFTVNNIDGVSSVISVGDTLEVVYTPNLQSNALSVGYWVKRTNITKNAYIGASYWEYKV